LIVNSHNKKKKRDRYMTTNAYIEIAIKEIETQKQIEKLVSESTTDESTRALLKENIASSISTHNFNTELERH
jgi:hypothetical protein